MSESALSLLAFLAALCGMEGVAWATHRWLMHGPLWVLHRSHHEARSGRFEANDLFAVFFAAFAIGLFAWGAVSGRAVPWWAGAGVTTYGLLYALVHDGLVHRRWPMPKLPRSGYLRRLVQAHRLHHAAPDRQGAVSFGFLVPGDVGWLAARLRARRRATRRA